MARKLKKILVIRLSSIGDIVLTSPIIRSLHQCFPEAAIHFLTKKAFGSLLQHHPQIAKVHLYDGDLGATIRELKAEGFDQVVDLHRNLRSRRIKLQLGVAATTYSKDRWAVVLHTKFGIGKLPKVHTVERYARAIQPLGCRLDDRGLDFFLPDEARVLAQAIVGRHFSEKPIAVVLGGNYFTKRWPKEYFVDLLNGLSLPVLLLGGKSEAEDAQWITERLTVQVLNTVAQHDLLLSAALLEKSRFVITHDTGLMHIATALGLPIYSIWGNTVPELGFAPYKATQSVIIENKGLDCRPCTKLGYGKCPKGHFNCMMQLHPAQVLEQIRPKS
ncbi:MAG TPA: glycosyltransferase family 9 protein [Bacteroidia bacterium]|nr:glycosyltransferase family 9 protein [Bacteroidia bacterium]